MGKTSKKSAKGRLDKYYKLAKEQGYRARSAFKLIQLNRKYEFLNTAKFCIDLCAAPGGWLQVASKYMPPGSLIIGTDLDPIKPIPRVTTFVSDITTSKCRQLIRTHAKDWQADVVLHDGAPNVGQAWLQDAYGQADLVLSSLKLATEFLRKGGTFITKVFRSKDYNSLMWVFNQLFGKVEATKPPSSRNVSAEIFVVCLNYHAPAHIDPKFLDSKHVFKDLESLPPAPNLDDAEVATVKTDAKSVINPKHAPNALNVFKPGKKERHRDGYGDDAGTSLFKVGAASQFVLSNGTAAITFLGDVNKIDFISEEEKRWYALEITTDDIKANCTDLKVLGKRDFQQLLKWRATIREELGLEDKAKNNTEFKETAEVTAMDPAEEEEYIQRELERLTAEEATKKKKERRKKNEKKHKEILKMQLRMTVPTDIGLESQDPALAGQQAEDIFDLNDAESKKSRKAGVDGIQQAYDFADDSEEDLEMAQPEQEEEFLDSDEEEEARLRKLEAEMDGLYDAYVQRVREKDAKFRVRENRAKDKARSEVWGGIEEAPQDSDNDSDGSDEIPEHRRGWDSMLSARAEDNSDSDDASSTLDDSDAPRPKKRRRTSDDEETDLPAPPRKLVTKLEQAGSRPSSSKAAQLWFSQDVFKNIGGLDVLSDEESEDEEMADAAEETTLHESGEDEDFEVVPQDDTSMWDVADENIDQKKQALVQKQGLLTAEAVTIAQKLVNREVTKTEMINRGFTKYSLNGKDDLPKWFLDEEKNFYGANLPITKEAVRMLRAKQRALDARPMKKIAEAKARKKLRAFKRIQKAAKQAEGLTDNGDMNERQKSEAIEKIMRKGMRKVKREPIKAIVSKGRNKGIAGRPRGVKGRFRLVDPRQKKDLRAEKRAAKAKKKRRH